MTSRFSKELLLQNLPGVVYRCRNDSHWTMEFVSTWIEELTGYAADSFTSRQMSYASLIHEDDRTRVDQEVQLALQEQRPFKLTYRITDRDGNEKWVWEQGRAVYENGIFVALEGYITDVTERKQAEMLLLQSVGELKRQAALLDQASDAMLVRLLDTAEVVFWNEAATTLFGWTREEAIGMPVHVLLYKDASSFDSANSALKLRGEWSGEIVQVCKDGREIVTEARWTLVKGENGATNYVFCVNSDISERKAAEQRIYELAYHDQLTGLPNRMLMLERLHHALAAGKRSENRFALAFIDLDHFKQINDTLGHDVGDLLLKQVAGRLLACVRESDTVARFGGDEFVVLIENIDPHIERAASQAQHVIDKILDSFRHPMQLGPIEQTISPSIGITLYKGRHETITELLKRADIAMYQAKTAGRNTYRFFNPQMQEAVARRAAMEAALQQGIATGGFVLHYQPQIGRDGRVIAVEALLRWKKNEQHLVFPGEFIPLAEETGLIVHLGKWALVEACRQLGEWAKNADTRHWKIGVNISAIQLRDPQFIDHVRDAINATGADPELLSLEVTESVVLSDTEDVIQKLEALKSIGVTIALDDFGTGYSSLSYLSKLPLDHLKIEQSFVRDVNSQSKDAEIAKSIVQLGQKLGLYVIVEGVETEDQWRFFAEQGCDAYQGFLFSRPLLPSEINPRLLSIH